MIKYKIVYDNCFPPGGSGSIPVVEDEDLETRLGKIRSYCPREPVEVQEPAPEWTGLGAGWLRDLLGKTEWAVDCLDLKVKL